MDELQNIQSKIYEIRGQRVMLDRDLAKAYGVETKALNQAVKRNIKRFEGEDFMFQLTKEECLRSQIVTLNEAQGHHLKYMPYAFTMLGTAMLSSVLRSETAIQTNRKIMRAFVSYRSLAELPIAATYLDLKKQIEDLRNEVDDILADQNDINEATRAQLDAISAALAELQSKEPKQKPRRPIGFVTPGDSQENTPPTELKSLLSLRNLKGAFSLLRGGKAAVWLGLMLLCLVSSCSKDDGLPPVTIEGMYEESKTLQYQTPDSIENFAAKFYGYLEVHPDACNHPYYGAIDNKIYDCTLGGGVYECPTGNE